MNVFKVFASLALNSDDFDKGLSESEKKASKFGKTLGTAGKAAGVALTAVATAAAGAATYVIKGAKSVAEYGDNIDKMSQKMGMSATAYQEWDFVMQHAGSSMDSMKASMKTLANAVESENSAFERLGITQKELASMQQEEIFSATIRALQNVSDETERTYLTGQLLGRGATELGALLNMTAEETDALKEQLHDLGGVMTDEEVKASAEFSDNLQDLSVATSALGRSLTTTFLPGISQAAKGLTGIFSGKNGATEEFKNGINSLLKSISTSLPNFITAAKSIAGTILDTALEMLPEFAEQGSELAGTLIEGILSALPTLGKAAPKILGTLMTSIGKQLPTLIPVAVSALMAFGQGIVDNIDQVVDSAIVLVDGLATGILNALPIIVDKLPDLITGIANGLLSNLPKLIEAGVELMSSISSNIPDIISGILTNLPLIISGLIGGLLDNIDKIIEAGIKLLVALVSDPFKILEGILKAIPGIVIGIGKAIIDEAPKIAQKGVELFGRLFDRINEITTNLREKVSSLVGAIVTAFSELKDKFLDVGKRIVDGIWEGIKGATDWIKEKVSGFCSNIWNGVKDFFGIRSPSKLFEWAGKMNMEGFAKGIDKYGYLGTDAVSDWSERINEAVAIDDINADLTTGSRRGVTVVQNIYAEAMTPSQVFAEAMNKQEEAMFLGYGVA